MNTPRNLLILFLAAGIGLLTGFALRGKPDRDSAATEQHPEPGISNEASAIESSSSRQRRLPRAAYDDSPLATQLELDLSMSAGVTRWLYWMEAIEKAELGDFPRLARLAEGNSLITGLLANRWVELDPRHMFASLVAGVKNGRPLPSQFESVLYNEWLKRDPDAVIAILNGPELFPARAHRRELVARRLIEQDDVERGLRLMSEWHITNHRPRMTSVAKWAAANPRHAAEIALAYPAGTASEAVMQTIGKEWAKSDPNGALQFAMGQGGKLGAILANATLKEWAGSDLNAAADWLRTVDSSTRNRLYPAFMEAWSKEDPVNALVWCEQNLTDSSLAQAVGAVFQSAAARDLPAAAGMVAGMQPSRARAEAARVVAEQWLPGHFSGEPVAPETIAWLANLDGESLKYVLDRIAPRWGSSDPDSLADFLSRADGVPVSSSIYLHVAEQIARKNPSEALEWASRLPARQALSVGSEAFVQWQRSQPEAAMRWLQDLPPSDDRREFYFQNMIQALAHDRHAAERFAALNSGEREAARIVIEWMRLAEERRAHLIEILKTP